MSLLMNRPAPRTVGQIEDFTIPFGQLMEAAWGQGTHDTILDSMARMGETYAASNESALFGLIKWNNGNKISADEANSRAAESGLNLNFDEDVFEGHLNLLMERKRKENFRNFVFANGQKGLGRNVASIGTQMIASVSNPVDFATMFVPVVGSGAKARSLLVAGKGMGRVRLARGVITEESLAKAIPFPKLTGAVIEGTVGAGIAEIPIAIANYQDQANYTASDFLINIGAGGVFAGTMRAVGSTTAKIIRGLSRETTERMTRRAIDQIAKGDDINVAHYAHIDTNKLRLEAEFDEKGARDAANMRFQSEQAAARASVASSPELNHPSTMSLPKGTAAPEGYVKVSEKGGKDIYQSVSGAQESFLSQRAELARPARYDDVKRIVERDRAKSNAATKTKQDPDGLGLASKPWLLDDSVDYNRFLYTASMRKELADEGFDGYVGFNETPDAPQGTQSPSALLRFDDSTSDPSAQARQQEAQESRIQQFIEEERRLQDSEERYRKLLRAEIEAAQAEGKILTTRESDSIDDVESIVESDDPLLDADIKNLRDELGSEAKTIRKPATNEKGIDAAVDCLLGV